ncbi:MAG: von Willebrand factor type A domain-containing protein [Ignavibacteriaceae bacterium]|nr:von Willebrand factor type A domain-containing protein [Ignavibacteriaceae bacterium]
MFTKITFLALLIISTISAKSGVISGKVTDAETGEVLIGANVIILNTNWGAATDIEGFFKIKSVPPGIYELKASYIGYSSQTIKDVKVIASDSLFIEIKLKTDFNLSEILVVESKPTTNKYSTNSCKVTNSEFIQTLHIRGGRGSEVLYCVDGINSQVGGYTAEFNQCLQSGPSNTEEYSTIVENEFLNAFSNPLSTFSIDVDAASYSNVRRFIDAGQLPPKDAVRVEEFINYFDYDYPQPKGEDPFSLFTELGVCPWNENNYLLHVGIKGKELMDEERTDCNLVFLLDVSGSMVPENKLPLVKKAFKFLVKNLKQNDKIAIVVYAGSAGLVLPATYGYEKDKIFSALETLNAGGSTAGGAGIQLAYKIAKENFIVGGNNRIILATDGDFNVGVSSTSELVKMIEEKRDEGIFLTLLGFGMDNYKDGRLEELADKGNGNYYYIDNILEAKKVFDHDLMGTLFTIAKDVKIQIEFNPFKVEEYRLIGYENRLLKKEDFADDKKDAGELGAGHTVTALYEIVPAKVRLISNEYEDLKYQTSKLTNEAKDSDELLTLKLRFKLPDKANSKLITSVVYDRIFSPDSLSENFNFSSAVAGFAMLLRDSKFKGQVDYKMIEELAENNLGDDKYGYRDEFISILKRAKKLSEGLSLLEDGK